MHFVLLHIRKKKLSENSKPTQCKWLHLWMNGLVFYVFFLEISGNKSTWMSMAICIHHSLQRFVEMSMSVRIYTWFDDCFCHFAQMVLISIKRMDMKIVESVQDWKAGQKIRIRSGIGISSMDNDHGTCHVSVHDLHSSIVDAGFAWTLNRMLFTLRWNCTCALCILLWTKKKSLTRFFPQAELFSRWISYGFSLAGICVWPSTQTKAM